MNSMRVFVSTGGARNETAVASAREVMSISDYGLELSGGLPVDGPEPDVIELSNHRRVMLHNYFPPPVEPFVLNLAEMDAEQATRSRRHVESALRLSAAVGASYFGVHAGALVSPRVSELGGPMSRQPMVSREIAREVLVGQLIELGELGERLGVRLLVENHVLTNANLTNFGANPLLLVDPHEIANVMGLVGGKVGLLLDVGHLYVSATTLGFDPRTSLRQLQVWAEGFHLSSNDGTTDEHAPLETTDWFWGDLDPHKDFYTVEIHSGQKSRWVDSAQIVANWLASGTPEAQGST